MCLSHGGETLHSLIFTRLTFHVPQPGVARHLQRVQSVAQRSHRVHKALGCLHVLESAMDGGNDEFDVTFFCCSKDENLFLR